MTPLGSELVREVPLLRPDDEVAPAVAKLVESGLPALPVCEEDGRLAGVFGERDAIRAILPGYVGELSSAAFIRAVMDDALEHRVESAGEPVSKYMSTEHVDVPADFSAAQLAEIFLHHRVAVVPVVSDERQVVGAVTRRDYVKALATKLAGG